MNFLQPSYLWAFAGLLVPLAIHLLSRKEGRVIRIGSIRHIRETPTRQFRSVRLNEYLLLFLRSLLLGGITLFISGWYLEGLKETHQWLLIEPGLGSRAGLKGLIDSLTSTGYARRFLIRDFPETLVSGDAAESSDYYSLLEELQKRRVEAVVIATNSAAGFSGPRLALPENVKWIEVAPEPLQAEIRQVQLRHDSVWERRGAFSSTASQFTSYRKAANGTKVNPPDTLWIIVGFDQEFETDKEIVLASLEAIKRQVPEIIQVESVLVEAYSGTRPDWLVWLSMSEPPAGAKCTIRFTNKSVAGILERVGHGAYELTMRLNSEVAVNRNLAVHLMRALFPDAEASETARQFDRRAVSTQAAFGGPSTGSGTVAVVGKDADQSSMHYLAIALLGILALERLVAYQRKQ